MTLSGSDFVLEISQTVANLNTFTETYVAVETMKMSPLRSCWNWENWPFPDLADQNWESQFSQFQHNLRRPVFPVSARYLGRSIFPILTQSGMVNFPIFSKIWDSQFFPVSTTIILKYHTVRKSCLKTNVKRKGLEMTAYTSTDSLIKFQCTFNPGE